MTEEYRIEGREPTIFRVMKNKDNPYVMVDRRPIDNPKLSYKAKGILTYLLSRPDGWEVNVPDLVNHGIEGPAAIRSGLKELRAAGHIKYNIQREGGYIKKWVIEVYEVPNATMQSDEGEEVLDSDFRHVGEALDNQNLHVENQQVGNPTQVLSTLSSTELSKRDSFKKIANSLSEITGGALNSTSADLITTWLDKHEDEWIFKAIAIAKSKGARSDNYVDAILIGWEKNGYPKTRGQRVEATKKDALAEYAKDNGFDYGN